MLLIPDTRFVAVLASEPDDKLQSENAAARTIPRGGVNVAGGGPPGLRFRERKAGEAESRERTGPQSWRGGNGGASRRNRREDIASRASRTALVRESGLLQSGSKKAAARPPDTMRAAAWQRGGRRESRSVVPGSEWRAKRKPAADGVGTLAYFVNPFDYRAGGIHRCVSLLDRRSSFHPSVHKSPNKCWRADVRARRTTVEARNGRRGDTHTGRSG